MQKQKRRDKNKREKGKIRGNETKKKTVFFCLVAK